MTWKASVRTAEGARVATLTRDDGASFNVDAPEWLRDGDEVRLRLEFVGPVNPTPINLYWPGN